MAGVNSILRTFTILDLIANSKEHLTSSEISTMLQIPPSTTHDIIKTLLDENIIYYKDFNRKTYAIGIRLFALSKGYILDSNIINVSKDYIKEFADTYEMCGYVLKPVHKNVIITYRYESEYSMLKMQKVGHEFFRGLYKEKKVIFIENENCKEVSGISVPLYDYTEAAIGELYFFGLSERMKPKKEKMEQDLLTASKIISEKLGSKG